MSVEDLFTPASKFFSPDRKIGSVDRSGNPFAKTIIWYDQQSPIYVCEAHAHVIQSLRWQGNQQVEDYDQFRKEAYQRLFEENPRCDVCQGRLGEIVDLGGGE